MSLSAQDVLVRLHEALVVEHSPFDPEAPRPCVWGFALVPDTWEGVARIAAVVPSGDRVYLTRELLLDLVGAPLYVYGNLGVIAQLDAGPHSPASGPLTDLVVLAAMARSVSSLRHHWSQHSHVRARDLADRPLVLATQSAPHGWPR